MKGRYATLAIVGAAMWAYFGLMLLAWLAYAWCFRADRPGLLCAAAVAFGTAGWWIQFRWLEPAIARRLGPLPADWDKDQESIGQNMDVFYFSPRVRRLRAVGWWVFVTAIPLLTVSGPLFR